jgi:hypothetical protein
MSEGFLFWVVPNMMKKVGKKALLLLLVASSLSSMAPTPYAEASISYSLQGQRVEQTPFDSKFSASANLLSDAPASQVLSAEMLFQTARSFRYTPDTPGHDTWQTPQETEAKWSGDCEDKSLWLYAQLKINGYHDVRIVVGKLRRANQRGLHVWVMMADDQGDYLILDPTAQKRIWRSSDFPPEYYIPLYSFDGFNRYKHSL